MFLGEKPFDQNPLRIDDILETMDLTFVALLNIENAPISLIQALSKLLFAFDILSDHPQPVAPW